MRFTNIADVYVFFFYFVDSVVDTPCPPTPATCISRRALEAQKVDEVIPNSCEECWKRILKDDPPHRPAPGDVASQQLAHVPQVVKQL